MMYLRDFTKRTESDRKGPGTVVGRSLVKGRKVESKQRVARIGRIKPSLHRYPP